MKWLKRISVVALVVLLTACSGGARSVNVDAPQPDPSWSEAGWQPGTSTTAHLRSGGVNRSFTVVVPSEVQSPAALVVMLHGGFGSGRQAQESYGWDELAASKGFVVVYPDGVGRAWNVGDGCCGAPGDRAIDDVAFIEELVDDVASSAPIDRSRIFATGMSNGAMMSYRLACDTEIFAAIAPVAGTIVGGCNPSPGTSLMHIHGLDDDSVHFDGSRGNGSQNIDGEPVSDVISLWRKTSGCDEPVSTISGSVTTLFAECGAQVAVSLVTIDGAGHQWPGSTVTAAQLKLGADKPSDAIDATETIWQFFESR